MRKSEDILKNISSHTMTILHDQGLYRHLEFSKNGSNLGKFEIVTWPGNLAFNSFGRNFVFRRLPDMLDFFRKDPSLDLGYDYLEEKCVAVDRYEGSKRYSKELFKQTVNECVQNCLNNNTSINADDLHASVDEAIFSCADFEHEARRAVNDFEFNGASDLFYDFFEHNFDDYTPAFIWCCHVVNWAVSQYDASKAAATGLGGDHHA